MKNKFLFYRIPETCDFLPNQLISSFYKKDDFVNINNIPDNKIDDFLDTLFLSGFFNNLSKTDKFFNNRFTIVFLRDPVQRFINQYYFLKNKTEIGNNPIAKKCKELDLEAYINSFNKISANHELNRQVCMLSNNGSGEPQIQLEQAKTNLAKFDFIGLAENSIESIRLLSYLIHWSPPKIEFNNTNFINKSVFDENLLRKIKELNQYDLDLYVYAQDLYEQQRNRITDSMFTELFKLRDQQKKNLLISKYKKILYYHIPKSAGTALFSAFRNYFGQDNVIQFPNATNFNEEKVKEYRDIQVLGGHFRGFVEAQKVLNDRYLFIILRDPVERFLSQYYYYKYTTPDTAEDKSVKIAKEKNLEDFVAYYEQQEDLVCSFKNRQVGHLKDKIGFTDDPNEMLEQAKHNLLKFDLVGIYEELDKYINILKKDLGLDKTFILPRENISKNKENINDNLKERIRNLNQLDYELYAFAKQLETHKSGPLFKTKNETIFPLNNHTNNHIKTIYLHVGMEKTATTSIQATLKCNYNLLINYQICFPININHTRVIVNNFLPHPEKVPFNAIPRINKDEVKEIARKEMEDFISEILNCKQDKLIISSEAILLLQNHGLISIKELLEKLIPNAKLNIVLSTREFVEFSASRLQEWAKHRGGSLSQYVELRNKTLDHSKCLSRLINVFGKNNIMVYKFEDALEHEYGPVGYFLEVVGIDRKNLIEFKIIKKNEGISDKAIDLLLFINSYLPKYQNGKLSEGRTGNDTQSIHKIRGGKYRLDEDTITKIKDVTEREKEFFKKEFGIKYNTEESMNKTSEVLTFDQAYYDDIIDIYPGLTDTIKELVYDYILDKKKFIVDKASITILEKIQKWIENNNDNIKQKNYHHFLIFKKSIQSRFRIFNKN